MLPRVLFLFTGIFMTAVSFFGLLFASKGETPEKISIGEVRLAAYGLLYLADTKGFFRDENLKVTFQIYNSGKDALSATIDGKADLATVFETPVALRITQGADLGVICTLHQATRNSAIVARRSRGIITPAQLRGKTIGITKDTSSEMFAKSYLNENGIANQEVAWVDVPPTKMVQALRDRSVDAVSTWNPHLYEIEYNIDPKKWVEFDSDVYTEMSMLVGDKERLLHKKAALTRLLHALTRSETYWKLHPEESTQIITRALGSDPKMQENLIRKVSYRIRLNNQLLVTLQQTAYWLREERKNLPNVDFASHLIPELLDSVKPGDVTLGLTETGGR